MIHEVSHVIQLCRGVKGGCNKTDSSTSPHSKVNIKSINKDECLILGITKDKMSTFVTGISHTFTFVP